MQTVIWAVVIFSVIIALLVALLLFARRRLVPQGEVKIVVNGDADNPLMVQPGSTLLTALLKNQYSFHLLVVAVVPVRCVSVTSTLVVVMYCLPSSTTLPAVRWPRTCVWPVRSKCVRIWKSVSLKKSSVSRSGSVPLSLTTTWLPFIKEFVVELPKGETMDFQSGGYIQIDVPVVTVDYKNINIDAHPEHHGDDTDKFRSEWDKFGLWDLKMVNDEEQSGLTLWANHPAAR